MFGTGRNRSGHRMETMYRRYDIMSGRDLREAGKQLAAYLEAKWNPEKKAAGTQRAEAAFSRLVSC